MWGASFVRGVGSWVLVFSVAVPCGRGAFVGSLVGFFGSGVSLVVSFLSCSFRSVRGRCAVSVSSVVFCGSRSLGAGSCGDLVSAVVRSVVRAGRSVSVGCAVGGDELVLRSVVAAGGSARVFAVGEPSGRGFWSRSFLRGESSVRRLLAGAPASASVSVSWAAGGPVSGRLSGRLLRRSLRSVWWSARSGAGAGLVAFVSGGFRSSPGSWRSVRFAVRLGLPVVVFPVGCDVSCFPVSFFCGAPAGRWVRAGASGVWASGWRFVPAG